MNITDLFLYYAIFSIIFAFIAPMLVEKFGSKILKKHGKKRKTLFTVLAFVALLFVWLGLDVGFSDTTSIVLWSIHILLFLGYLGFSIKSYCDDKKRIALAEARRLRRLQQQN